MTALISRLYDEFFIIGNMTYVWAGYAPPIGIEGWFWVLN